MPCLLVAIALFLPRAAIVLLVIFSDYIGRAYHGIIWPLLGFFRMPYTTLTYAWAINSTGKVEGLHLVVLVIAVLADLGVIGGGGKRFSDSGRRNVRVRV